MNVQGYVGGGVDFFSGIQIGWVNSFLQQKAGKP
jgi:hypothetical protein